MAVGDNNPRVFADTVTIDAWRSPFDGTSGEADLHVDVVFAEKGRVGGGDAPVRFRLSLKRAEVHVVLDNEGVIAIRSSSVRRADLPSPADVRHTTKKESRLAGRVGGSLSTASATLSAEGGAGTSVTTTETLDHCEAVMPMEVTHWKTDRGYAFKIAARPVGVPLNGQPWSPTRH